MKEELAAKTYDEFNKTPTLEQEVEKSGPLQDWLVTYVGDLMTPEDNRVTVDMIVQVMAKEFPDFLFAVAEENWIRGYQQALTDIEIGEQISILESDEEKEPQGENE